MEEGASGSLLGVAIRDLSRVRAVATIVARHGFGELLMGTSLGLRLFRGETPPPGDDVLLRDSAPVRFTRLLASLGPTYIKLGQILSMRKDLIPADYVAALETLQDRAPVLPFAEIREAVEAGLGAPLDELYRSFESEALATASIAQTHLAATHDGERVVVKVQRPGIETTMRSDLDLLYLAAQVLEVSIDEMQLMGVSHVVEEFEKALLQELDFRTELGNLLTARQLLDPKRALTVPKPHPELSCRSVLTMQYFEGRPLRELVPRSDLAKHAVEEIVHASCKQVFVDGFFHGDPHTGNILIDESGTLCMIDLGLAGRLSEERRDDLVTLALATIANDSATLARVLLKMGTPTQRVNLAELRAEIERIRSEFLTVSSLADVDSSRFAEEFAGAAQRFRIKLAPEYSVLSKAASTIEGLIRHLHPEVDLVSIARPYVQEIMARRLSPSTLVRDLLGEVGDLGSVVRRLPGQLDQILHDVEMGNFQVRAVTPELDDVPSLLHQLGSRVSLAAFALAMTLCAAVVLPDGGLQAWQVALCAICALIAAGAWTVLFWWHVMGRGKPIKLGPLLKLFHR